MILTDEQTSAIESFTEENLNVSVQAVPGAGKSTGMAAAAAMAIARYQLHARRLLVVVTFTRSAADNIKGKIIIERPNDSINKVLEIAQFHHLMEIVR